MTLTVGIIGQSNVQRWKTDGTDLTADANLTLWNGSTFAALGTTGNGQNSFGNSEIAVTGEKIRMINGGVGGSSLTLAAEGANDYWRNTAALSIYDDFKSQVTAAVGSLSLDLIIWAQGERDAGQGISEAAYQSDLESFITSQIRADFINTSGLPNLPVVIMKLGDITATSESNLVAIRDAQDAAAASLSDAVTSVDNSDIPLSDGVHYTTAGYITHGERAATATQEVLGISTGQFGYVVEGDVGLFIGASKTEWQGPVNETGNIGENNLLYPTISSNFVLNDVKVRGKNLSGVTDSETTVRIYDSEMTTVSTQRRPTGLPLWEGVIPIPAGVVEAEHSISPNIIISVSSPIIPILVAYNSSAQDFQWSNTAATWTNTVTAPRSTGNPATPITDAVQAWGNAGSTREHVIFAGYSLVSGVALTSPHSMIQSLISPMVTSFIK